ncbi:hypothetical protein P0W64_02095 [Tsukamurella sp. 8F]|uniref:hypothetical protein n=1 Tax=unclassified Tsukamurella TaxID=2633480 RepID=UPI0023B9B2DB|nr:MULTISPECIES: hypothetical protein [unclassified Tsukamurella]MDF0528600.1 hypothetical protein [Tsukamurella sp. 8J]MDF0585562.1 hypothetical protein [Tsukamurella sp. 8F]
MVILFEVLLVVVSLAIAAFAVLVLYNLLYDGNEGPDRDVPSRARRPRSRD